MALQRTGLAVAAVIALTGAKDPMRSGADVSQALRFSDVGNCAFSPGAEAVFNALLSLDQRRKIWLTPPKVTIGPITTQTHRIDTSKNDVVPGGKFYEASAAFPSGTLWNGLKIAEIRRHQGDYPESDSFEERRLVFNELASRVQAVMKQIGASVPLAPKFRELDEGVEDVCGGAMSVVALKTGAYLACNWNC